MSFSESGFPLAHMLWSASNKRLGTILVIILTFRLFHGRLLTSKGYHSYRRPSPISFQLYLLLPRRITREFTRSAMTTCSPSCLLFWPVQMPMSKQSKHYYSSPSGCHTGHRLRLESAAAKKTEVRNSWHMMMTRS